MGVVGTAWGGQKSLTSADKTFRLFKNRRGPQARFALHPRDQLRG